MKIEITFMAMFNKLSKIAHSTSLFFSIYPILQHVTIQHLLPMIS